MKHLLVSREYPPSPGGGIGTYVRHIAHALAAAGDTVHVIGQRWRGADEPVEVSHDGRLVVHRIPFTSPDALFGVRPHPALSDPDARALFRSGFAAQAFAWQVAALAERLVEDEGIDVIEAPEYEAPLYFFQLRRAQGLGPVRRPPVIVHLHSPSEFIARHNEWDPADPMVHTAGQLERSSILAADALLCPSNYLRQQAAAHYGLPDDAIEVIPYPLGPAPRIDRPAATWSSGSVLYVGRLERRKGVVEWLQAATAVARQRPEVRFEFVGTNHLTDEKGGEACDRIPRDLRRRFTFHEHRERSAVHELLARARLVVVPSRWENFPYTCMEAMASGVPVMASPHGGMAEMIVAGESGWIAASSNPADLAATTLDALGRGAVGLERAGAAAGRRIVELCGDDLIVRRQREFRGGVITRGPKPPRSTDDRERLWVVNSDRPAVSPARPAISSALSVLMRYPARSVVVIAGRVWRRSRERLRLL